MNQVFQARGETSLLSGLLHDTETPLKTPFSTAAVLPCPWYVFEPQSLNEPTLGE